MSLDIYLEDCNTSKEKCLCPHCDNEHEIEVNRELYHLNVTHNLGKMADEANLYQCMWRPEEEGITHGHQMIDKLQEGLDKLIGNPDKFVEFNPKNGWGSYESFVKVVEEYLRACRENPAATIRVWR